MKSRMRIAAMSFLLCAFVASAAWAAQYDPIVYSLGKASRAAELIVAGRVVHISVSGDWKLNEIGIEERIKGDCPNKIVVKTSRRFQAGPPFVEDERCVLFLYQLKSGQYAVVFDAFGKLPLKNETEAEVLRAVRKYAAWSVLPLGSVPFAEKKGFLLDLIQSRSARLRISGCIDLAADPRLKRGGLNRAEMLRVLAQLKKEDGFSMVKPYIVDVLSNGGTTSCIGEIADQISKKMSVRLKVAVAHALVTLAGPKTVDVVLSKLSANDRDVRANATEVLARTGLKEAEAPLKAMLSDPVAKVRAAAVMGLCTSGSKNVEMLHAIALTDKDPTVKKAALQALGRLECPEAIACLKDIASQSENVLMKRYARSMIEEKK